MSESCAAVSSVWVSSGGEPDPGEVSQSAGSDAVAVGDRPTPDRAYLGQSSSESATSSRCERPSAANRVGREELLGCGVLVVIVSLRGRVTILCALRAGLDAPRG